MQLNHEQEIDVKDQYLLNEVRKELRKARPQLTLLQYLDYLGYRVLRTDTANVLTGAAGTQTFTLDGRMYIHHLTINSSQPLASVVATLDGQTIGAVYNQSAFTMTFDKIFRRGVLLITSTNSSGSTATITTSMDYCDIPDEVFII